jgi:MFS family permease
MAAGAHLTAAQTGLIASANFFGYLLGALAGAAPQVRQRPYGLFFFGLFIGAAALAPMGADYGPASMPMYCFLRFVGGFFSAFVIVCLASLVAEPAMRMGAPRHAMTPFMGVGLGIAASSLMVVALERAGHDWRTLWHGAGVAALALALFAKIAIPQQQVAPMTTPQPAQGAALGLTRLIFSYGLFGFGYVITATFLMAIVRETPSLLPVEPYAWALVGLAGAASILFWNAVAARTGRMTAYRLGMIAEALGVTLTVVSQAPLAVLTGGALLGGTFMAITAVGLNIAREMTPQAPLRAQAVMTIAFGAGQIVGPAVAGLMREATGSYFWPSLVAAAALTLGAILPARRAE